MTTPFVNNPFSIIRDAMREAKLISATAEPNSAQYANNLRRLQDLVSLWQTQGIKLFLMQDISVTLVAGQQAYTFQPGGDVDMTKPLNAIQGYYLDSANVRRPLFPISWEEWLRLSQVTQQGQITQFFVDKQATLLRVRFWLIPDTTAATGTAHLLMRTQVTRPISLTETMEFPIEWRLGLLWGLADEICGGQPQGVQDRCRAKAQETRAMLEGWDVEDTSVRFEVDTRMMSGGAFR